LETKTKGTLLTFLFGLVSDLAKIGEFFGNPTGFYFPVWLQWSYTLDILEVVQITQQLSTTRRLYSKFDLDFLQKVYPQSEVWKRYIVSLWEPANITQITTGFMNVLYAFSLPLLGSCYDLEKIVEYLQVFLTEPNQSLYRKGVLQKILSDLQSPFQFQLR
jgi:hypothetical protein